MEVATLVTSIGNTIREGLVVAFAIPAILMGLFFILRWAYNHFLGFHGWLRYHMETRKRRAFRKRWE